MWSIIQDQVGKSSEDNKTNKIVIEHNGVRVSNPQQVADIFNCHFSGSYLCMRLN